MAAIGLAATSGSALAHHSFAVFFDADKTVTLKGVAKEFVFSNPHGVLTFVVDKDGKEEVWKAETNAPVILRRLGWSPDSVKPGDKITVEGWPARDGSNYIRMRRAFRGDGTPIGIPITAGDQK
jgi:hypothetical protein